MTRKNLEKQLQVIFDGPSGFRNSTYIKKSMKLINQYVTEVIGQDQEWQGIEFFPVEEDKEVYTINKEHDAQRKRAGL